MLTAEQVAAFHRDGFLKAGAVMGPAEADDLRDRMMAVIDGRSAGRAESVRNLTGDPSRVVVQIVNIWDADDGFRAHIYNPVVCGMVAQLMRTDTVRVWHDQVQYKPPRTGGATDWHQDHPYWPIIEPAELVSAWVALDDATIENGCMRMVPGSHRWGPHKGGTIGTRTSDFAPQPDLAQLPADVKIETVACEVRKGEVMFHHCLTWHGSPPNRSDHGRPAIAVHYMPGHTRYVPRASHLVEHNVHVAPGAILVGGKFPTVWKYGRPVKPRSRSAAPHRKHKPVPA